MKICNCCKLKKDLDSFDKHPKYKDGHVGKCKDCRNKARRLTRSIKNEPWYIFD